MRRITRPMAHTLIAYAHIRLKREIKQRTRENDNTSAARKRLFGARNSAAERKTQFRATFNGAQVKSRINDARTKALDAEVRFYNTHNTTQKCEHERQTLQQQCRTITDETRAQRRTSRATNFVHEDNGSALLRTQTQDAPKSILRCAFLMAKAFRESMFAVFACDALECGALNVERQKKMKRI